MSESETPAASAPATKVMPRGASTSLLFTVSVVLSSVLVALPVALWRLGPAVSYIALGVLLLAIIAVYVVIYRRERTLDALKLPLLIVAVQVVLGVVAIIAGALG